AASPCSAGVPGEPGGEKQEPRDSVGSHKRAVRVFFEITQFTRHIAHGEMLVDDATNGCRYRQSRMQAIDAKEQPIAVDTRMPVKAAVEQRMKSARTFYVRGVEQHVVHLVGIFTRDIR